MKFTLDCVPCIIKQAVEAPKLFDANDEQRKQIVIEAAAAVADFDFSRTPPEMGGELNRIIERVLGVTDPYAKQKKASNEMALELLPQLRQLVESAADPFTTALRIAIAGNVIDFGIPEMLADDGSRRAFDEALTRYLHQPTGPGTIDRLREAADQARDILYLCDNTGEIVVDRLLIEQLPPGRVTAVVRGGPAINDALMADAIVAGIDQVAEIIDSGVAIPGTPLAQCPAQFVERIRSADLIISKGQGNYETMSHERGPIFFALMAKCPVVARQLDCSVGDFVITEPLPSS